MKFFLAFAVALPLCAAPIYGPTFYEPVSPSYWDWVQEVGSISNGAPYSIQPVTLSDSGFASAGISIAWSTSGYFAGGDWNDCIGQCGALYGSWTWLTFSQPVYGFAADFGFQPADGPGLRLGPVVQGGYSVDLSEYLDPLAAYPDPPFGGGFFGISSPVPFTGVTIDGGIGLGSEQNYTISAVWLAPDPTTSAPEPGSLLLLSLPGMALLAFSRRRLR